MNKNILKITLGLILLILSIVLIVAYFSNSNNSILRALNLSDTYDYIYIVIVSMLGIMSFIVFVYTLKDVMSKSQWPESTTNIYEQRLAKDLEPVKKQVTIMSCKILNFNSITAQLSLEDNYEFVNEYYTTVEKVVSEYKGVMERSLNDTILVNFGSVYSDNLHPINAVKASLKIKEDFNILKARWQNKIKEHFDVIIGINTDIAVVGVVGTKYYPGYTSVGESVNISIKLSDMNNALKTQILISSTTFEKVKNEVEYNLLESMKIPEIDNPINIYELTGLKSI